MSFPEVVEQDPQYFFWAARQKKPSKFLACFVNWVRGRYDDDPSEGTLVLKPPTAIGAPVAKRRPEKQTNLQMMKEHWSKVSQCEKCVRWTFVGSNKFQKRRTCLDCGLVETIKIDQAPPGDPARCLHARTNHQGSTATVSRTFCLDCKTYVHEEPQTEEGKKQRAAERKQRTNARIEPEKPNPQLTHEQVQQTMRTFRGLAQAHLRSHPETDVTLRQLESLLQDAADIVLDDAAADPPAPVAFPAAERGRFKRREPEAREEIKEEIKQETPSRS